MISIKNADKEIQDFEAAAGIPWVAASMKYRAMLFLVHRTPVLHFPSMDLVFQYARFLCQGKKNVGLHSLIFKAAVSAGSASISHTL